MRNVKIYKNIWFIFLTATLLVATGIAVLTYVKRDLRQAGHLTLFAIQNHLAIMLATIVIATIFGFFLAQSTYRELSKSQKETKTMLDTVLLFLGKEEREIVNFLVKQQGTTTQAEISRLPHMNRVKAFRSLQKMRDKNIVEINEHGKVRNITLKENILHLLKQH